MTYTLLCGGEEPPPVPGCQLDLHSLVGVVAAEVGLDLLHGGLHPRVPPHPPDVMEWEGHCTEGVVARGKKTTPRLGDYWEWN